MNVLKMKKLVFFLKCWFLIGKKILSDCLGFLCEFDWDYYVGFYGNVGFVGGFEFLVFDCVNGGFFEFCVV